MLFEKLSRISADISELGPHLRGDDKQITSLAPGQRLIEIGDDVLDVFDTD